MAQLLATSMLAGMIMIKNPTPANPNPNANFVGLEMSILRAASHVQTAANTGAKMMMNSEFTDWNQVAGTSKLPN